MFSSRPDVTWIQKQVRFAVQNFLEVFQSDVEKSSDTARKRAQEPDVSNRRSKLDVTETLTADFGLNDFDAAFFADDATMLHALVLAAVALVIFHWSENLGAEQAIALRLERTIVDGLRLLHFAKRPLTDFFRRSERNANARKAQGIFRLVEKVKQVFHASPQ